MYTKFLRNTYIKTMIDMNDAWKYFNKMWVKGEPLHKKLNFYVILNNMDINR